MGDVRSLAIAALIVAAVAASGCGGPVLRAQESVTFGVLLPFSSGMPGAARAALRGAQLAAAESTGAGAAHIVLMVEDDRGIPEVAATLFGRLMEQQVVAVIGPLTDQTAIAVAPVAERAGVPIITPGATGAIPYAGSTVFRTSLPAQAQAHALADFAVRIRGARSVSMIHQGDDYGAAVALAFAQRLRDLGGDIVGTRLYRDGETDFTRHASGVTADEADAVLIVGYADEGVRVLRALREHGFAGLVLGSDALYSSDLLEWGAEDAEGMFLPAAFVASQPLPAVADFVGRFRSKYRQTPDHFAAQGYDAAKILAFAVRRGGRTPEAIRAALQGLRGFPGATGEITFGRWGGPDRPVAIAQVAGGAFEVVRR